MEWTAYHEHEAVMPDFEIKGSRILLRPPKVDDEVEWISLRRKNKDYLQPYEPKWARDALSPAFFQRRIVRVRRDWAADRAYSFLIFRRASEDLPEKMIGGMNINNVCRGAAQFASIGYWLDHDHQGSGYMRAALRMIIYFSHEKLKLHRINASVLPDNEKSINLLKRVGFDEEGFAEKYIEINGAWQDHILYGLVLSDFMAREQD
jgi:ribosomal-protein-alanine N-acetyltransferase